MSERWRIFVVEDEERLNRNIVNSLRKDGYIVNGTTNGRDAVHILWAEEHDVVICDLKTPGADGFEVLQWLRAYRPNTRVILIGEPGNAARTQALESGAVSYLEKPLDLHLLKEELRRLLVQTGFSASLDSFDLLDVIQIISTSRKSIALLVSTGLEERGMLCFHGGSLVWAEYGVLRGEGAFFALAAHKNGTVVHQPWNEQVTPNVTQPLSRLILQAFQYRTKYAQAQQQPDEEQNRVELPLAEQDEDSPFLVLTEHMEHIGMGTGPQNISQQVPVEVPVFQEQGVSGADGADGESREWWEQTNKFNTTGSDDVRSVPVTPFFGATRQGNTGGHKTEEFNDHDDKLANHEDLPSWLTDQPTAPGLPAIRSSSFPGSTQKPRVPTTPKLKPAPAEWQPPSRRLSSQRQQLQRLQRPIRAQKIVEQTEEATDSQQTLAINTRVRRISPEWEQAGVTEQSPSGSLRSIITSRKKSDALSLQEVQANDASSRHDADGHLTHSMGMVGEQRAIQTTNAADASNPGSTHAQVVSDEWLAVKQSYNYTVLVSVLQTLSYSIKGFIAAAVVSADGQPIAQVAVEDLDTSRICKNFSVILMSVLQSLEEGAWGVYENTVITSADRHILMRVVGGEKNAFQVLITTREADPNESVEVMASIEEAVAAALRF